MANKSKSKPKLRIRLPKLFKNGGPIKDKEATIDDFDIELSYEREGDIEIPEIRQRADNAPMQIEVKPIKEDDNDSFSFQFAEGGFMEGKMPGSAYGMIGSTGASIIDSLIKEDPRVANPNKMAATSALEMAGQGAAIGSLLGPIGTIAGAGIGAIGGAVMGKTQGDKMKAAQSANLQEHYYGKTFNVNPEELAFGGDITEINGPRHENGGVPMGQNAEVEGGEVKVDDYIFSDRLTHPKTGKTYADEAKKVKKKYEERDDSMTNKAKMKELTELMQSNESARIEEETKRAEQNAQLDEDFQMYGGYIKRENGGFIVDPKMSATLQGLSKERGYKTPEKYYYALGGPIEGLPEGAPTYWEWIDTQPESVWGDPNLDTKGLYNNWLSENFSNDTGLPEVKTPAVDSTIPVQYQQSQSVPNRPNIESALNNQYANLPAELPITGQAGAPKANQVADDASTNDDTTSGQPKDNASTIENIKNKLGEEEWALLAANLPALDNLIKSTSSEVANFGNYTPETVDYSKGRQAVQRQAALARETTRENVRGIARSSGQALSNLATSNAALNEQVGDKLLQSLMAEENANVGIKNQASQINQQINVQETIANEQNRALADSARNLALSDFGQNTQGYLRDKKMARENKRQNDRLMEVINSVFPNYKWEDDNGELAIKFANQLTTENTKAYGGFLLPKM